MGIFPAYITNEYTNTLSEKYTPKEYEIDFNTGQLTGRVVEGLEAIKVWIWVTLQTVRYRYPIYSWDYGSELEDLIGQGHSKNYIITEAQRMIEDCLLINDNIQSITDLKVDLIENKTNIEFAANTIYGTVFIKE